MSNPMIEAAQARLAASQAQATSKPVDVTTVDTGVTPAAFSPAQPISAAVLNQNPNVNVFEESQAEKAAQAKKAGMRTFIHQVAGACVITPEGKRMVFGGKVGLSSMGVINGQGFYITDIPGEVAMLDQIAKMPTSQVTELISDPIAHTERAVPKAADPSIQQSARDAALNSERVFNPQVSAAVENLGGAIAAGAAADAAAQNL